MLLNSAFRFPGVYVVMSSAAPTLSQSTSFEIALHRFDATAWERALRDVRSEIHEVDRAATEIWFRFYPLELHDLLADSDDPAQLVRRLGIEGDYRLADQIATSHRFLYGHRFWAAAKKTVEAAARSNGTAQQSDLAAILRDLNRATASAASVDPSLTFGITFAALMTLRQAGLARFGVASAEVSLDRSHAKLSPEQVLRERAKDDSQGIFGFLRTEDKRWTVTFDEADHEAKFKCTNGEEMASGAARDTRDWNKIDPRRSEGPIPVQCRAAACGTCWVGVLGGAEKLSPVSRLEGTKIKEFGYIDSAEERPLIRLACMAQAGGAVSVVIPPWNGFYGKHFAKLRAAASNPAPADDADATVQ